MEEGKVFIEALINLSVGDVSYKYSVSEPTFYSCIPDKEVERVRYIFHKNVLPKFRSWLEIRKTSVFDYFLKIEKDYGFEIRVCDKSMRMLAKVELIDDSNIHRYEAYNKEIEVFFEKESKNCVYHNISLEDTIKDMLVQKIRSEHWWERIDDIEKISRKRMIAFSQPCFERIRRENSLYLMDDYGGNLRKFENAKIIKSGNDYMLEERGCRYNCKKIFLNIVDMSENFGKAQ